MKNYKVLKNGKGNASYKTWEEAIAMVRYYYQHGIKGYRVVKA